MRPNPSLVAVRKNKNPDVHEAKITSVASAPLTWPAAKPDGHDAEIAT